MVLLASKLMKYICCVSISDLTKVEKKKKSKLGKRRQADFSFWRHKQYVHESLLTLDLTLARVFRTDITLKLTALGKIKMESLPLVCIG